MARFQAGLSLYPQDTSIEALRSTWREADAIGADSIWVWDHFFPLYGDPDAPHFECYSMLGAMAADTSRARFGALVTCNSYRNPNLLAAMAGTLDCISGGRFTLGIGAGWFERDYVEYGYEFGTVGSRLRALDESLPIIKARLGKLIPQPPGPVPIMVGGGGEKVTLHIVAKHADAWNSYGPPENYAHKSAVLDAWCERVGRDPSTLERTVCIAPEEIPRWQEFLDAGAHHLIVNCPPPYDLDPLRELIKVAQG